MEFVKKMCGVFDLRWQFGDQWVLDVADVF